ncbi:hypothetical protein MAHJHV60_47420 [Mycobacterium avium subsp. hominissuis]
MGTVAESVDGVFTGRLVGDILHGTGKAHAVDRFGHRAQRAGQQVWLITATPYELAATIARRLGLTGARWWRRVRRAWR